MSPSVETAIDDDCSYEDASYRQRDAGSDEDHGAGSKLWFLPVPSIFPSCHAVSNAVTIEGAELPHHCRSSIVAAPTPALRRLGRGIPRGSSSSEPAALECWHDPAHAPNRFQSPTLVVKEEMTLDGVMAPLADHVPDPDEMPDAMAFLDMHMMDSGR
jgi:hypothetical protein